MMASGKHFGPKPRLKLILSNNYNPGCGGEQASDGSPFWPLLFILFNTIHILSWLKLKLRLNLGAKQGRLFPCLTGLLSPYFALYNLDDIPRILSVFPSLNDEKRLMFPSSLPGLRILPAFIFLLPFSLFLLILSSC